MDWPRHCYQPGRKRIEFIYPTLQVCNILHVKEEADPFPSRKFRGEKVGQFFFLHWKTPNGRERERDKERKKKISRVLLGQKEKEREKEVR